MLSHSLHGRVELARIESHVLEDNALGDPSARDLVVYLPPSYDGTKRFPVVYLLPAFPSAARALLGADVWKPNVFEIFDRSVVDGSCPELILVGVEASTSFGGSQYLDSPATGAYQTYLAEEVIPFIDRKYRTVPTADGRAVAGRSSGGFGAIRLAMDRPGLVSAVASHAGDAAFELSLRPMFVPAAIAFEQAGGFSAFAERVRKDGPKTGGEYDAVFFLAAAAAYAADRSLPFPHAVLPFDVRTALPITEIWSRWTGQDPLERLSGPGGQALRTLRLLYLDAGARDEYGLQFAARLLAEGARALGVRVVHDEFDGGHRGTSHRFEISLGHLARTLALR